MRLARLFPAAAVVLALGLWAQDAVAARWSLALCNPAPCHRSERCVGGRCVPTFRIAQSMSNDGGLILLSPSGSVTHAMFIETARRAFDKWTTDQVTCGTKFDVADAGLFSFPDGYGAMDGTDGKNSVMVMKQLDWRHGAGVLGMTHVTLQDGGLGSIVDGDIEFNGAVYVDTTGNQGSYDLESLILHEVGHFAGLQHSGGTSVMAPTFAWGEVRRTLTSSDEGSICGLYPGEPGAQGDICEVDGRGMHNCSQGRVCEGRATGGQLICTQDCLSATATNCPPGYTCQASTSGFACLPIIGSPDLCKFCASSAACSSGVCLRRSDGTHLCTVGCSTNAQCGQGYQCELTVQGRFCTPTAGSCLMLRPQCQQNVDCAPGFKCLDGMCIPTRVVNDRCELHQICPGCSVCVAEGDGGVGPSANAAYCRSCCSGGSATGQCGPTCTTTICAQTPGPMTCAALAGGVDRACVPTGGAGTCEFCSTSVPCRAPGTCINGLCRSACNPKNPGACPACVPYGLTETDGICACPFELAAVNQRCGLVMDPMNGEVNRYCPNGMACVGSTDRFCRAKCTALGEFSECAEGYFCNGQACVPGETGRLACVACANGQCGGLLKCHNGKCYNPCNIFTTSACLTCIQQEPNGDGVCACDSQKTQRIGQACDAVGEPRACTFGGACNNGKCRTTCDPTAPTACVSGETCQLFIGNTHYCVDTGFGGAGGGDMGGTGGTGGGTTRIGGAGGTAGGQGGAKPDVCGGGCSSAGPALALGVLLVLRRRKRGAPRSPRGT